MRCKNYYNILFIRTSIFLFISSLKFSRSISLSFCLSCFRFSRSIWFSTSLWFRINWSSSFNNGLTFSVGDNKVWLQEHDEVWGGLYGGMEVVWTHWKVRFGGGFGGIEVFWTWKIAKFCTDFLDIGWGVRIGLRFESFPFQLFRRKLVILFVFLNILAGLFCPIIAVKTGWSRRMNSWNSKLDWTGD